MIITHANFSKGFRGGERQTLLLIQELSNKGYTQRVVTRVNSELADKLEGIKNLTIHRLAKPYAIHISQVKDSSVIHAHEAKAAQFAYFANMFYKIPYIITRRVDNKIKNNIFNRSMYANTSYVVTVADDIQAMALEINKDLKIKTIYSAFSTLEIDENKVQKIQERFKGKFLIGHIGELDNSQKGQYFLIEAMRLLAKEFEDIHLICLGKGKDADVFKEQSKDLTNITFEGFVNNVGDYIQCFDIFAFPSLREGIASILFDIMQSNVAIATTDVNGIPEYIKNEKNGLLVKPKDIEGLYKAIKKLYLDEKLRERLTKEAFITVQDYSVPIMANKYEEIYKEVK